MYFYCAGEPLVSHRSAHERAPRTITQRENATTSDYIGVYTSVTGRRGLMTTQPRRVHVGGLRGVVFDLRLRRGAGLHCPGYDPLYYPIIIGIGGTVLDHGVIPHIVMRLHLLQSSSATLAVEVDDVTGGRHLDR